MYFIVHREDNHPFDLNTPSNGLPFQKHFGCKHDFKGWETNIDMTLLSVALQTRYHKEEDKSVQSVATLAGWEQSTEMERIPAIDGI